MFETRPLKRRVNFSGLASLFIQRQKYRKFAEFPLPLIQLQLAVDRSNALFDDVHANAAPRDDIRGVRSGEARKKYQLNGFCVVVAGPFFFRLKAFLFGVLFDFFNVKALPIVAVRLNALVISCLLRAGNQNCKKPARGLSNFPRQL